MRWLRWTGRLWSILAPLLATGIAPAQAEILVGAALPMTGPNAYLGDPTRVGIQSAIDDLNKEIRRKGGRKADLLRIVWADDGCDGNQAKDAADYLISQGVAVVVGHLCSGAALEAASKYDENGVVLISTATNPGLTDPEPGSGRNRRYDFVFRAVGRDNEQAKVATTFIKKNYAKRRIAVLNDAQPFGRGLAQLLKDELGKSGIEITLSKEIGPGAVPVGDAVNDMVGLGIEAFYFAGYSDVGGDLRRRSWDAGLKIPMLSGDGIPEPKYWWRA